MKSYIFLVVIITFLPQINICLQKGKYKYEILYFFSSNNYFFTTK